jgi:methyltransferase (TIGR00027 family)
VPVPDPVARTAQWMAAERARESARPDRLFDDPYAETFAGTEGWALLDRMAAPGGGTGFAIPIRTRFFDDALRRAVAAGVRQVVLLAAGMDARAFRLDLPAGLRVYELDRPELLALKETRVAELGARPRCARTVVGVDLAGEWADGLVAAGLGTGPTLWLAEGLLPYLDAAAVHRLFAAVTRLSAPGDRLLTDVTGQSFLTSPYLAAWLKRFADNGMPWRFGTDDPRALLAGHGWDADVTRCGDEGAHFGRWPWPPVPPGDTRWPHSYLVVARRAPISVVPPSENESESCGGGVVSGGSCSTSK